MTTETDLVQISNPLGTVETNISEVRRLLFGDKNVVPTDVEIGLFLKVCSSYGLNPYLKDAHLIKYANHQPAAIVVGKDAYTKKARSLGASWLAGIVVRRGQQIVKEEGALQLPTDELIGGWAAVMTCEGQTFRDVVSIKEYGSHQSTWKSMPATMIRKVALVHALREAFPDIFGGLYDASEMAQAFPQNSDLIQEIGAGSVDMPRLELPMEFSQPIDLVDLPEAPNAAAPDVHFAAPSSQDESEEIPCPLHVGDWLKKRTSKHGPYWSHQITGAEGASSKWCNLPSSFRANSRGKAMPFIQAWSTEIHTLMDQANATADQREIYDEKIQATTGPEAWIEILRTLQDLDTDRIKEGE